MNNNLNEYFEQFGELFLKLQSANVDSNVIIGGKFALELHGLNMSNPPSDLDLIIYMPNHKQSKIFEAMRELDTIEDRPSRAIQEVGYDGATTVKVIKIKLENGMMLDIIKEEDRHPDGIETLLTYSNGNLTLPVQSIRRVIEAKASYSFSHGTEIHSTDPDGKSSKLTKYMRSKDLIDFLDLKNLNFNTNKEK